VNSYLSTALHRLKSFLLTEGLLSVETRDNWLTGQGY